MSGAPRNGLLEVLSVAFRAGGVSLDRRKAAARPRVGGPMASHSSTRGEWHPETGGVPLQPEHPTPGGGVDADGELLHGGRQPPPLELEPRQVLGGVVLGAPLARLPVDDQLRAGWAREGPERVAPGWDGPAAHGEGRV